MAEPRDITLTGSRVRLTDDMVSTLVETLNAGHGEALEHLRSAVGTVLSARPTLSGHDILDVQWDHPSILLPNITAVMVGNLRAAGDDHPTDDHPTDDHPTTRPKGDSMTTTTTQCPECGSADVVAVGCDGEARPCTLLCNECSMYSGYEDEDDGARCPRCGRLIADVSDGEPSRIMDVTEDNAEWADMDLCVKCAEYLDPTEL